MKKWIFYTSISILAVLVLWTVLLLNPGLSYDHKTEIDNVNIYHNNPLSNSSESIINNVMDIIKKSELYDDDISFDLCLNDDSRYITYHPVNRGLAYSFSDKSVMHHAKQDFDQNIAIYYGIGKPEEIRRVNLTWIIAHEFTHNLQSNDDIIFQYKTQFWQQEGYAEYISREWQKDGLLKEKIEKFIIEENRKSEEFAVFILEDGTEQNLLYYKYGLMTQYLMEIKGLSYKQFNNVDKSEDEVMTELLLWSKSI